MEKPKLMHKRRACTSCPFRKDRSHGWFLPDVLDATVGDNLRGERHMHVCHLARSDSNSLDYVCVGFMHFIDARGIPNLLRSVGESLGVIDYSKLDPPDGLVLTSWEDVLEVHRKVIEDG